MSDYTKQLEQQNEQLQQKLAEVQRFVAWKDKRTSDRLHFYYTIEYACDTVSSREFVTRCQIVSMLHTIKTNGIQYLLKKRYKGKTILSFSMRVYGIRDCRWHPFREPSPILLIENKRTLHDYVC
jgi:hypothetical protein